MRAKLVFEKFSEDGDPIADMGIGLMGKRTQIKKWFDSANIQPHKYTIDDDLNITVKGFLDLYGTSITKLPDNLRVEEWLDL